jgi:hypothetical protein
MFPEKTFEWMRLDVKHLIEIDGLTPGLELLDKKMRIAYSFGSVDLEQRDKKNRWFGYCQAYGELLGLWTLEEIIKKLKEEFKEVDDSLKSFDSRKDMSINIKN